VLCYTVGMRPLKSLTLGANLELLATTFEAVDDSRAPEPRRCPLPDTLMSGFAMMFFQHLSLLQFQRAMGICQNSPQKFT
jgi:hypothetical protein